MNSITKLARLPTATIKCAGLRTSASVLATPPEASKLALKNFDPNNYNIPLRPVTMDDLMEPYGSWKVAYEREKRSANFLLLRGFLCLLATCTLFWHSGVSDGIIMPNLDNIMEETEPFEFDKEGRITV